MEEIFQVVLLLSFNSGWASVHPEYLTKLYFDLFVMFSKLFRFSARYLGSNCKTLSKENQLNNGYFYRTIWVCIPVY